MKPSDLSLAFVWFFPLSPLNAEKLHWPKTEFSKKSILSPAEHKLNINNENSLQHPPSGILKDTFTTGTSSYNVLLQSKEEKKHHAQKQSSAHHKKHRKTTKCSSTSRSNEHRKIKAPLPLLGSGWFCANRQPSIIVTGPVSTSVKFTNSVSVAGSSLGLPSRPRSRAKRHLNLAKPKQSQSSKSHGKEGDASGQKLCLLAAIKPSNVEKEKRKFFESDFTYNPQFEYANPALPSVLAKHSHASDRFLKQVIFSSPFPLVIFLLHLFKWCLALLVASCFSLSSSLLSKKCIKDENMIAELKEDLADLKIKGFLIFPGLYRIKVQFFIKGFT